MRRGLPMTTMMIAILAAGTAFAGDWPQWLGPNRNGIAAESPPLVDGFTDGVPKRLWTSEEIIGGWSGGWGTVAVADGCAYVFSSHNFDVPIPHRKLDKGGLERLGWAADMPEELSKKVEEARTGEERKALKDGRAVNVWADKWMQENVTREQRRYRGAVQTRLRAGDAAVPLDILARLATVQDREFPTQEALDAWFTENGIDDAAKKQIDRVIPTTKRQARDFLLCTDAADGSTKWKKEFPATAMSYPGSATPCVVDGHVYLLNSEGYVYCLSAVDGSVLWKTDTLKQPNWGRTRSSSAAVVDGVVVVMTEACLIALDAQTGEKLWSERKIRNEGASPTPWTTDGKSYVLANGGNKLNLVEVKTGKVVWSVKGGGEGSAVVAGDVVVLASGKAAGGVAAYTLSLEEPKELWRVPLDDDYTSPVVYEGHVYAIGLHAGKWRAVCIGLASGKVLWEEPLPKSSEYSTPIVADGKLIAVCAKSLHLIRATPEKYSLLGKADLGVEPWTSPTFADGKAFLRTAKAILCFDLKK